MDDGLKIKAENEALREVLAEAQKHAVDALTRAKVMEETCRRSLQKAEDAFVSLLKATGQILSLCRGEDEPHIKLNQIEKCAEAAASGSGGVLR